VRGGCLGVARDGAARVAQYPEPRHPAAGLVDLTGSQPALGGTLEEGTCVFGIVFGGTLAGAHQQERFLALPKVAADGLAPALGVGGKVEEVVLDLEGAAQRGAGLAQRFGAGGRGIAAEAAQFQRGAQERTGFAIDHVQVLLDRNGLARLEGLVERLPFAEAARHAAEGTHQRREIRFSAGSGFGQEVVGAHQQQIAGQQRRAGVPPAVHGRAPPTLLGVVHHIVVHKREVVEGLHRQCRREGVLGLCPEHLGREQEQDGPQALAVTAQDVAHRVVE
jgi:hypothetical protein